jgi:nitrate/nitrite transport system substrate-binding protein
MRRWGQLAEAKPDAWFDETAKSVYRPDIYRLAAKALVDEGKAQQVDFPWETDGYRAATSEFIDGIAYDGKTPNAYLEALAIGLKGSQRVVDGATVTN